MVKQGIARGDALGVGADLSVSGAVVFVSRLAAGWGNCLIRSHCCNHSLSSLPLLSSQLFAKLSLHPRPMQQTII